MSITAPVHGGGPRPGPRRYTRRARSVTLVYSDGPTARSWGWWCIVCTPPDPEPHEVVGSNPVMLQAAANKCAKAHERSRHDRRDQT